MIAGVLLALVVGGYLILIELFVGDLGTAFVLLWIIAWVPGTILARWLMGIDLRG